MLSIVIPVYKNKQEFLKNLKHNLKFLEGCQVVVVNDDPAASLKQDLKNISGVELIENEKNIGFGGTVNIGITNTKNDYVMLLNSDVILNDVKFKNTIVLFKINSKLFAVSFAQKERDNTVVGKNRIYWSGGFLHHSKTSDLKPGINGWAEGGSCVIDKNKFTKLGGFDLLYSPFYWEDVDLSYRAWKAGYEVLFDPSIEMIHFHESTIGKYFSKNYVKSIALRNQFIFIWKNIADGKLMWEHGIAILKVIITAVIKGEFWKLSSLFSAIIQLPEIMKKRNSQKKMFTKSDKEILNYFL